MAQVGFDPGDLVYLVIIVLSVLGALGKKIRDKYQEQKTTPPGRLGAPPAPPSAGPPPAGEAPLEPSKAEVILAELFDIPVRGKRPPAQKQPAARPQRPAPVSPRPARPQPPAARKQQPAPPQRRKGRPQARPAAQSTPQQPEKRQPVAERPARRVETPAEPVSPGDSAPIFTLTGGDLRRAIILSEILGPPMAARGGRDPFERPL